ncbi:MAG: DUF3048 domain-containing protein [Candidatus Limnocylindrales bacterium]
MDAPKHAPAAPRLRARRPRAVRRIVYLVRRSLASPGARANLVAGIAVLVVATLLLTSCAGSPTAARGSAPVRPSSTGRGTAAALPAAGGQTGPQNSRPGASAATAPAPDNPPTPAPLVEAPTDGVLESPAAAAQPVVAVMIDDAPAARPQSGLADADILIQAPAEGGIPRYMALYQSRPAPSIGPIRSSRRYFVGWAAAWRPLYAHVGGAPNALAALQAMNGQLIWNADEFAWAEYMPRITSRVAPHNVYSSSARLDALAAQLAVPPAPAAAWSFVDPAPLAARPTGGSLVVPYPAGVISYAYDRSTDRYLRSVDGAPEKDAGTGARVAPYDVVVLYVAVGPLANAPGQATNQEKGRLEVGYLGSGQALVLQDGTAIDARWSKTSDAAPLLLTRASGTQAGTPISFVRGQIAIQVVPLGTAVTLRLPAAPGAHAATPI